MKFSMAAISLLAGALTVGCGGAEDVDDTSAHYNLEQLSLDGCSDLNPQGTYPQGTECICPSGVVVGCSSATCRGSTYQSVCGNQTPVVD